MKIEIKSWINGNILFTHDCENNTIKITLEAGIKIKANLSGANLDGANLYGVDLSGANLSRANLSRAYLSRAYLSGANLSGANLDGANLYGVDLSGANLYGANLSGANLDGANLGDKNNPIEDIKQFGLFGSEGRFTIAYKLKIGIYIKCGCFEGSIDDFKKRVKETHKNNQYAVEYNAIIKLLKTIWGKK